MIGKFLDQLTPEQEDRVLESTLVSFGNRGPCLLTAVYPGVNNITVCDYHKVTTGWRWESFKRRSRFVTLKTGPATSVAGQFDDLCLRSGSAKVNELIKQRIRHNRIMRALNGNAVGTAVGAC